MPSRESRTDVQTPERQLVQGSAKQVMLTPCNKREELDFIMASKDSYFLFRLDGAPYSHKMTQYFKVMGLGLRRSGPFSYTRPCHDSFGSTFDKLSPLNNDAVSLVQ